MPKPDAPLEGLRVLVAEDAFHITLAVETALEAEGAVLAGVAGSLHAALETARSEQPDLAIVDLYLGSDLSLPLIRELRDAGTRVVLATGYDLPDSYESELAGLPVLKKPYTTSQLVELVRSLI